MSHKVKYPICGLCENFRWFSLAPQHGECVVIPGERSPQSDPCDNYRCGYNEETIKSYIELGQRLADIDLNPKNIIPIYDTPRL
jgi:hypothetical protein